jgi:malonyl CoA-acyl carrier protein transacylase
MVTCVFPGQGSQAKGMGAELFQEFPDLTKKADEILGYSITELCTQDTKQQLNQTQFTQPALYVVNALAYQKWIKTNAEPTHVMGHSLGEFDALLAAKVFDFETGLKLVKKRGELMQTVTGGGMAAIIGITAEKVTEILSKFHPEVTVANYNSILQTVITGKKTDIVAASATFEKNGAMVFPLNVSGAFHSPYLKPLQQEFEKYLHDFSYNAPKIAVIGNYKAELYKEDEIISNLSQQLVNPVLWTKSVQFALNHGETVFEEVGPGKVLTGLIARIRQGK